MVAKKKISKKPRRKGITRTPLTYKAEDYVRLKPFEGNPEEFGMVLGPSGNKMYVVRLADKYRDGPTDDLLREVSADQMEPCAHKERNTNWWGTLTRIVCKDCGWTLETDSSG